MRSLKNILLAGVLLCGLSAHPVHAQDRMIDSVLTMPEGNILLHISATEKREVQQDMLVARLEYRIENSSSKVVQRDINKMMQQGLALVKGVDGVKAETKGYRVYKITRPRTKEQVWSGYQMIEMHSQDSDKLLDIAGKMQDLGFLMQGMNYTLTDITANEVRDDMMEDALKKLQARADRAAHALGKEKARLVEVNVEGGHMPTTSPVLMRSMMEVASSAPVAEGGETTLSLTVSAKALLKGE